MLKEKLRHSGISRPYKWNVQNITDLLHDIEHAIGGNRLYTDFKYRIGTVILHKDGNILHIMDGQK